MKTSFDTSGSEFSCRTGINNTVISSCWLRPGQLARLLRSLLRCCGWLLHRCRVAADFQLWLGYRYADLKKLLNMMRLLSFQSHLALQCWWSLPEFTGSKKTSYPSAFLPAVETAVHGLQGCGNAGGKF